MMNVAARHPFWIVLCATAGLIGCNSRPATVATKVAEKTVDPADQLADSIREEMRKSTDPGMSRRLTDQINNYLPRLDAKRKPQPLSESERALFEKDFALRPREVAEVARAEFTSVDAHYLDEVLLFRDVARSLDVDNLPPVGKATAALAWVVRNFRGIPATGPALPVGFVAMRGAAGPLERTYVFLALLRQLGVDAALIGDANAGPAGIWAVGVLADGQVYLFDARLGLPLPGPDGNGVLTLAQARTAADPFKPLAVDLKLQYDVTADRAKRAEVFVTAPLSAMAPRMRFLQNVTGQEVWQLAADVFAERDRFRKAVGDSDGAKVQFWCPPAVDALPRLLFAFLPASEGGGDTSQPERRSVFVASLIPFDLLPPFLRELQGEPRDRFLGQFLGIATMLDAPGRPHDLVIRGQFREATDQLMDIQTQLNRRLGDPAELSKNAEKWANAARAYSADQIRLKQGRGDAETAARMDANRAIAEQLWQSADGPVGWIASALNGPHSAEATYLLGLCKHEEAERQMSRPEAAGASQPNWSTAIMWWTRFLSSNPTSPWAPAAKRNLARALEASGQRDAAKKLYVGLADTAPTPHERLACRYLAEKMK